MFDIGASELLVIVIVAVIVIGPKDLPLAMRTAGRWIGKMRKISGHFRSGIDAMVREAELEEMEKKWKEQNARIMREHPQGGPAEMQPTGAYPPPAADPPPASAESAKPVESAPTPAPESAAKPGDQA
ncbi:twin-arginine translocase subunit TatB [Aurantiacibacter xanthus]|uniref:Sec-independent protein translocase protein TatB n=1 Tax=Aurantiacibacter xanthus TaxID=1784712 RepID=A0A3A1P3I7_9SPHN|nr:Sec-independent protein translocase protein TatB [Aurantiacibacter xanthus]RIV83204.1 twin-arginine translocase subunit TatB [Aurantiacibacter xanthus]